MKFTHLLNFMVIIQNQVEKKNILCFPLFVLLLYFSENFHGKQKKKKWDESKKKNTILTQGVNLYLILSCLTIFNFFR